MPTDAAQTVVNLLGKSSDELREFMQSLGEPAYRGGQIYRALYAERRLDLAAMSNLPVALRERFARKAVTVLPQIVRLHRSLDGTVRYVLRVLPQLLAATAVLVLLCCGSAALLVATLHVDALTAYLATTPGGLDSVTVIALSSGANAPLVLAIQALRLFVVLLTAPWLAKLIVRIA